MDKLSIDAFKTLIEDIDSWTFEQSYPVNESLEKNASNYEDGIKYITSYIGTATITADYQQKYQIEYTHEYVYDECEPDTFDSYEADEPLAWSGFCVVDEDGDELDSHDITGLLSGFFTEFNHSELIDDICPTIDVDTDTDTGKETMEQFIIRSDNEPDLRFTGEVVAHASSYSSTNSKGRWTDLCLYKTKGGKYVCESIGRTQWQGEKVKFKAYVAQNFEEIKEFFGQGWLAKELYDDAQIENVIDIE